MANIIHLTSVSHLNEVISTAKDKLIVIDFHATWCGPCHAIAPKYESLATMHTNVQFCKCDVDAVPDVARLYSVSAMPTFIFLKGGKPVDVVRGADPRGLENAILKHSVSSPSATSQRASCTVCRAPFLLQGSAAKDLSKEDIAHLSRAALVTEASPSGWFNATPIDADGAIFVRKTTDAGVYEVFSQTQQNSRSAFVVHSHCLDILRSSLSPSNSTCLAYLASRAHLNQEGTLMGLDDEMGQLKLKVSEKSKELVKKVGTGKDELWKLADPYNENNPPNGASDANPNYVRIKATADLLQRLFARLPQPPQPLHSIEEHSKVGIYRFSETADGGVIVFEVKGEAALEWIKAGNLNKARGKQGSWSEWIESLWL